MVQSPASAWPVPVASAPRPDDFIHRKLFADETRLPLLRDDGYGGFAEI